LSPAWFRAPAPQLPAISQWQTVERFPAAGRARETELLPVTRKIDLAAAFEFRSQRSQIEYSIRSVPLTFSNRDSA